MCTETRHVDTTTRLRPSIIREEISLSDGLPESQHASIRVNHFNINTVSWSNSFTRRVKSEERPSGVKSHHNLNLSACDCFTSQSNNLTSCVIKNIEFKLRNYLATENLPKRYSNDLKFFKTEVIVQVEEIYEPGYECGNFTNTISRSYVVY